MRTNRIVRPSRAAISAITARLSALRTYSRWCDMVATDAEGGAVECVTGLRR
ncbi:Uncharacterised protein [Mycobacteroides abscessus subsp. abscessus]|nr:Uncharacterised protein [Mycobacteroides abscessus subsp. abscessus]